MPELYMGSDPTNIQYGGGVIMYWKRKDDAGYHEIGHFTGLTVTPSATKEELPGSRKASRATVKTRTKDRKVSITCTAMELSSENVLMAVMSEGWTEDNQVAGFRALASLTVAEDLYVAMGHDDVFVTKIPVGTITGGPFQIGETVTGGTSSATGTVAWAATGLLELVNVSGAFVAGETLTGGTSSATAAASSVQKVKDAVVVDSATPTVRYVLGEDYDLDADYGMLRVRSDGDIVGNPFAAYSYDELKGSKAYNLDGGDIINKQVMIVTDPDNDGPRYKIFYPSVDWSVNGDWAILIENESSLPFEGTVLEDSTQPSGQEYGYIKMMK